METARPVHPDLGGFMRTVTKIVRFRRQTKRGTVTGTGTGVGVVAEDGSIAKVKFPELFDDASLPSQPDCVEDDEKKHNLQLQQQLHREAVESLLAKLFASVSAVKAAYAQLQIAQSPYDPDTIQSADQVVVSELKELSQLKHSYFQRQDGRDHPRHPSARDAQLLAELQEQRNLIKAFQITAKKMESDLQHKDTSIILLQQQLSESEKLNRSVEGRLHPDRSLQVPDGLHLSALNPAHLLAVLRYTVKSIRSFAKLMAREMERAGWDLAAAAASIGLDDPPYGKAEHRAFAFESYVCRVIFSDFHQHGFGLCNHAASNPLPDRQSFFREFAELKSAEVEQILHSGSAFREFCGAKYLVMVHPRMEESFFGNLDHRALVGSGEGFPETEFFVGFAEMARRVWVLHRLFFSFEPGAGASIFQVRRGCRFSEVYMESVVDARVAYGSGEGSPVVGFTVVPGFKLGKTVVQCKVYPVAAVMRPGTASIV
uniref:Putative serine/threonine-protein kinase WNK4 n=1 Tax=Anthurium amnicola TaxID=1678845 RepID=A0A1D1YGG9_9ARAE